jgi:hypothetical protein
MASRMLLASFAWWIATSIALAQTPGESKDPRDARIREALEYALAGMLRAQYPNGAWPQGSLGKPYIPADHPPRKASLPEDWRERPKITEYWFLSPLNDHSHTRCVATMLEAHRRFGGDKYLEAARRAGDFLIQAQLPDPQPAWAQQYTFDMLPCPVRPLSSNRLSMLARFSPRFGEPALFLPNRKSNSPTGTPCECACGCECEKEGR